MATDIPIEQTDGYQLGVNRMIKSMRLALIYARAVRDTYPDVSDAGVARAAERFTQADWEALARVNKMNKPSERTVAMAQRWLRLLAEQGEDD